MSLLKSFDNLEYSEALESNKEAQDWLESKNRRFGQLINGKFVTNKNSELIDSLDPSNGDLLAHIEIANSDQLESAVKSARKAQPAWEELGGHGRAKVLYALARLIQKHARLISVLETLDNGKPIRESRDIDIPLAIRHFYHHAGWAQLQEKDFSSFESIGVVAQIVPWNFPLLMLSWKIAPALAMGNTVVIKSSELAPATMFEFAKLVEKTGIPKGVVNVVTGFGDPCGKALTTHKDVERIAFTGGPETARHIIRNSAENLSQVSLELGGKSPVAVFEDADQENALNGITAGIFGASGQSCIAGSRLYLQKKIYNNFLDKLVNRANKIKLGNPMDSDTQMGPLSSLKQLEIIEKNIKLTVDQGGKIKCGGKRHSLSNKGYYFPPTIIECENHNLPTAENELFGPILSVMKFETEEEVINKMNDNQYGLSSGVYTSNLSRGLRVSKAIRAGITFVNTYRLISPSAPFGGIKDSGYGKEAGIDSIKDYTRVKTTWFYTSDEPSLDPFSIR